MSIVDRSALEESPLADLHAIASELSIDGYRRLRRAELIDAILRRQGGDRATETAPTGTDELAAAVAEELAGPGGGDLVDAVGEELAERPARRRRGRRGGRGRSTAAAEEEAGPSPEGPEEIDEEEEEVEHVAEGEAVSGVVELLPNGSGFLRVNPPEPSDEDVYISGAQVRRCELVPGDRISGPRRPARRSERFASLIRIDTINDRPASEVADVARYDDLPAAFPSLRFKLGSEDPTVKAIEWLTPFGQGSRVTIVGGPRAGKTEALRRLAAALSAQEELELQMSLVLVGVRPEEISEWAAGPVAPAAALTFAASADAQAQALEPIVDQARRLAARGTHTVVLIDTLDGVHPHAARKLMASARNLLESGSLTMIATASAPIGGETTVIALDASLASTGRFPAVDLASSWTMRAELLVGEAGAEAIVRTRAEALDG
jgi:transcription termination factor Rho